MTRTRVCSGFGLLLLFILECVPGQSTEVCVEGYIMDKFCILRGALLDNPSLRPQRDPDRHSIHCLVDIDQCVSSGYELLKDPADGDAVYGRWVELDATGNELVLKLARETGLAGPCTTCSGGTGSQTEGFRAAVVGRLAPDRAGVLPRRLLVSRVLPSKENVCQGYSSEGLPAALYSEAPVPSQSANPRAFYLFLGAFVLVGIVLHALELPACMSGLSAKTGKANNQEATKGPSKGASFEMKVVDGAAPSVREGLEVPMLHCG
eukprot:NODE_3281_length_1008_cov_28.840459_g3018_i0.p1 GENE.NODE_3281_length_1008_cov_28.840459_g3018_i0~~NODE_3281_length_1008_cov_28.840459_g3018_i0.p1  ORF type:complete len:281 (+),score=47.00 NODE_3281_length_1008_cov_28.840459_g3018_i0:52-843(+)